MLRSVTRPDGKTVTFKYDALGRRKEKRFDGRIHRYLWDGNVVLHEWAYAETDSPQEIITEDGRITFDRSEPADDVITWVYDTDSYVPTAKIENGKTYSIVSDYIGRPVQAYDECGTVVWQADYDIYGNLRNLRGDREFIPFRQVGQYEDTETGLYYNRFRYYDPNIGNYISQDPIGLAGNNPTLYGYVSDSNSWVDEFGLYSDLLGSGMGHHLMPRSIAKKLDIPNLSQTNSIAWYPNDATGTAMLHQKLHARLIEEGVPFHGSKFTGTVDDFFKRAEKAYKDIEVKGYIKKPVTDEILYEDVTPLEGLQKLKELCK